MLFFSDLSIVGEGQLGSSVQKNGVDYAIPAYILQQPTIDEIESPMQQPYQQNINAFGNIQMPFTTLNSGDQGIVTI